MDYEFLDLYNAELQYLNEHAEEFAREFPGIAERLGGLVGDSRDPTVSGLLEGAAFLAARVQLKLRHEFLEFTANYLEQLLPGYLSPIPSALLARIEPPFGDPALKEGIRIPSGEIIEATYLEAERRIACRYQLRSAVTLWPLEIVEAATLPSAAAVHALDVAPDAAVGAGLRLRLLMRGSARREDDLADDAAEADEPLGTCTLDELTVHLVGREAEAVALYEQIFARLVDVWIRYPDRHGDPVVRRLGREAVSPVGLSEEEMLIPQDNRMFRGFHWLQEYFLFPRKFLGLRLSGLRRLLRDVPGRRAEVIFTFTENDERLGAVAPRMFALHAAPAINLFERQLDRVTVSPGKHEYHVMPDRSRVLDYEPHRIGEVVAHLAGGQERVPVRPLYAPATGNAPGREDGLVYTVRRIRRRRSAQERRSGRASDYAGTDMFVSIAEPQGTGTLSQVAQLSIKALCSNRHLTEQLPVGDGGVDFTLLSNTDLAIYCVAGPTKPRPPVVGYRTTRRRTDHTGSTAWRLVHFLGLNQMGLVEGGPGTGAHNLRELLTLVCDPADPAAQRRADSVRAVDSRPVVRRMRSGGGFGAARGLEVTVTLEERAFEGSGAFLLGVLLDQFFAEYVSINRFTQTVLRTVERGEVMRWPPRTGTRRSL